MGPSHGRTARKMADKTNRSAIQRPSTHAEINEFRRIGLMEGTITSMAEFGVAGTTLKPICDAAGASRGLTGHYFASKEALVAEAFKHLFNSLTEQVAKETAKIGPHSKSDQLRALPTVLFSDKVFTKRNRGAFLSFWHEVRFNPLVKKANRELYTDYAKRVESYFAEAAAEAGIQIDARNAALGLIALMDGLWLGLSIHDKVLSQKQATELCQRFIDDFLPR